MRQLRTPLLGAILGSVLAYALWDTSFVFVYVCLGCALLNDLVMSVREQNQ